MESSALLEASLPMAMKVSQIPGQFFISSFQRKTTPSHHENLTRFNWQIKKPKITEVIPAVKQLYLLECHEDSLSC